MKRPNKAAPAWPDDFLLFIFLSSLASTLLSILVSPFIFYFSKLFSILHNSSGPEGSHKQHETTWVNKSCAERTKKKKMLKTAWKKKISKPPSLIQHIARICISSYWYANMCVNMCGFWVWMVDSKLPSSPSQNDIFYMYALQQMPLCHLVLWPSTTGI